MDPNRLSILVLSLSGVLQLLAALGALGEVNRSGRYRVYWGCVSGALFLMFVRRFYTLVTVLRGGAPPESVSLSLLGLLVSLLLAVGIFGISYLFGDLDAQRSQLIRLSRVDSLTGVWNRRHTLELATRELEGAKRYGRPLTLLMVDVDRFKSVNDRFGHAAGDEVLQLITSVCAGAVRSIDTFGRIGGEEFMAVLPETPLAEGIRVAERLRRLVKERVVMRPEGSISVTVSVGCAELVGSESVSTLLSRADAAMYRAKMEGGDQVSA